MGASGGQLETAASALVPEAADLGRGDYALVVVDPQLRVAAWNRPAADLYGLSSEESLGRPFTALVSCFPERTNAALATLGYATGIGDATERSLRGAGLIDGPARHRVRSGREVSVNVSVLPLELSAGPRVHVLLIRDDAAADSIAEPLRVRLGFETLVSDLCARLSNVAEDDLDAEIERWLARLVKALDVDRSCFAQFGPDRSLVVTHAFASPGHVAQPRGPIDAALPWLTQEWLAGRSTLFARIPEDLPPQAVEERRYCEDAGLKAAISIPVQIAGAPICVLTFGAFRQPRAWAPEVIARLQIAGDAFGNAIARRAAKRRLEEKQVELAHVGRVAALGKMASVIAHELEQPLTVVVGNAEALRQSLRAGEPDVADADEALLEITEAAMRISEIVRRERQLLRKAPHTTELLDLNDAVREVEFFIRAEARQFGTRVVLDLLPGLPAARFDRVQLQQVVFNLARNALQAMAAQPSDGRTLTIGTAAGADAVTLTVNDTGPPADALVLRRMFEPFYTTKPEGLGMGLSISKSIVDDHHGRIWATANAPGGVTMHVSLPRK